MTRLQRPIGNVAFVGYTAFVVLSAGIVACSEKETQAEDEVGAEQQAIEPAIDAVPEGRSLSAIYMNNQDALDLGKSMFRGLCSGCHGGAARGGKGPNLTDDKWLHGDGTDKSISGIIERGVPSTTMKKLGESLSPDQIGKIIAYVRTLSKIDGDSNWKPYAEGDATVGEKLFFDAKSKFTCNKCHALDRRGGGIGPSLDRIASRRSPQYIMESIVNPSKDIDPRFEQVLVVTDGGKAISGLRINETNFTIQIREQDGRYHSFNKRDLEEVRKQTASLMPNNMSDLLTVQQLHDLFAFLMSKE